MSSKRKAASDLGHVFVLTIVEVNHGNNHIPETKNVGVFDTKEAAAAIAGKVDTPYGPMESEMADGRMFEDDHEDNRDNPPDCGVLMQLGSEESGEGDYVSLMIEKFPVQGMPEDTKKSKK